MYINDIRCKALNYAAPLYTCPIHRHMSSKENEGLKSSREGIQQSSSSQQQGQKETLSQMVLSYINVCFACFVCLQ